MQDELRWKVSSLIQLAIQLANVLQVSLIKRSPLFHSTSPITPGDKKTPVELIIDKKMKVTYSHSHQVHTKCTKQGVIGKTLY